MKSFAPVILLAAGAIAAPSAAELCARELSEVNTIMTTVLNGIQSLDGSINAYSGGPGLELVDASNTMLTIIRTATNNAAVMIPLTIDEAIAFQPLSDELNAAGDKLLVDLEAKVPTFAQSHACATALNWVAQVGTNVNTLMTTISAKFPAGGKGGEEIEHFNGIFSTMQEKLSECAGPGADNKGVDNGSGYPTKPAGASPTVVGKPTAAGNGTKNAAPTSTIKPVVTAGAAAMTFSTAGLVAAFAAFFL
ncbi:hypothetical protein C8034_v008185 [Colletotrichum sidae]|uniref:Uncharacterized protein n=3 Tax=Colletotrichum orbiculare species complex TaxID=2707354 RepID=N4VDM8_COLOR|nr:hypothetical protein Cob_v010839 [Colletotrichum orbiculare MAFF 240422]TDZ32995.1 hypothetical protein C8035_v006240 [Colletotrichum spinosum]TEA20739.1 hypothetical protein C8034_v008185 [Colletotrichum sidae]